MAVNIRHNYKSGTFLFFPNGGVYLRFDNNVCVQHLGGYAGGRRGD